MSSEDLLRELSAEQCDHQLGRRRLLTTVAAGAVGLGLAGATNTTAAQDRELAEPKDAELPTIDPSKLKLTKRCPDLRKVSKYLRARMYLGTCEKCPCGKDVNFIVPYHLRGLLYSNRPCDETADIWPDRTEVAAEGTMTLRQTKCEKGLHLVGCNEGTLKIYGKSAGVVAEMFGTQGFETHATGEARCCAFNHGEGTLKGHGYEKLEGCRLCVSYANRLYKLDPEDPCSMRSISLSANWDGVLICHCEHTG
jgi:hypothetical protein